ncbi:MAG: GIY-YIG nuclease family protein [Vulcanimicrobiaceae bacterium]
MAYYVYMLRCFDGTFYTGVTNDFDRRFYEHSSGFNEECYTFTRRPLRVAYVGEFEKILDAIDFEKKLKSWSHKKKRAFAEREWAKLTEYSRGPDRPVPLKSTPS